MCAVRFRFARVTSGTINKIDNNTTIVLGLFSYYFVHQNWIETCVMPEITIIKIPFQLMEEIHSIQNATKKRMKRETFLFAISIEKVTFDVESFKSIPFSSECHRSFCWVKNISMRKIHIQSEWFSAKFWMWMEFLSRPKLWGCWQYSVLVGSVFLLIRYHFAC